MESLFLSEHARVAAQKKQLDAIADKLKDKFVGLDNIIDDAMSLVSAWYIFPQAQLRPCVINLWGLTGSGKTALINSLVDLLDHRKFYAHFDMGELQSESSKWIKRTFVEDLAHFNKEQAIICLDEFQFARSISKGEEIQSDKLRVIWELMDSGMINYIPDANQYYVARAEMCITRLKVFRSNGGEIRDGEVISGSPLFHELFESFFFDRDDRHEEKFGVAYLKSRDFIDGIMILDDSTNSRDIVVRQVTSSNLDGLISYLTALVKRSVTPKDLDLRHSLIFVLGNLDEAYTMSSNLNPDISADDLHEITKDITIMAIKDALKRRFRSEQVARLGNNHFLYRAFSSAQFREIIRRELQRVREFCERELSCDLTFDESVIDLMFSEGVIPSQGTRPVFTTVNNLIQSRVSKLALHAASEGSKVRSVRWSFNGREFVYELSDIDGNVVHVVKETVSLQVGNQRASVKPHIQAHIAVHEAGHAILASLLFRIIPSVVVSRSAAHDTEGFCRVRYPEGPVTRDSLKKNITITLGGLAAEKLIFGEENTCSGVGSDIEFASMLANDAVRRYAMGSDPIRLAVVRNYDNEDYFVETRVYEEEAVALVRNCMEVARAVLEKNKLLLLRMSEYLTSNSKMDSKLIEEFAKMYSAEEWVNEVGFIQPADYYSFDKVIRTQLKEMTDVEDSVKELVTESLA